MIRLCRIARCGLALALLWLGSLVPAFAGDPATGGPETWRNLPWHLADVHHSMPPVGSVNSIEVTIDIEGRIEPADNVYISAMWGTLNGEGFYFGFLSNLYDYKTRKGVGRGVLFSRWGKGTLEEIRPAPGGFAYIGEAATSGEGDFASVRHAFDWQPGRYTFAMRTRKKAISDPENTTWVDLLLYTHATQTWHDMGGLRFPARTLKLGRVLVSFVEIYKDREKKIRDFPIALPNATVTLDLPIVNRRTEPISSKLIYATDVPIIVEATESYGVTRVTFDNAAYSRKRGLATPQTVPAQ